MMKSILSARLLLLGIFLLAVLAFFAFDFQSYFTLEYIKSKQLQLAEYYQQNFLETVGLYLLVYITVTALSLPGAAVMTLLGGALFGLFVGTVLVSIASTVGATLAFLASRYLLRSLVENRFRSRFGTINNGIEEEGVFYLFTLRLIPAIPFFIINVVMGLTNMPVKTFFLTSQLGMLPGTVVYVNAGTQLAQINSLSGIISLPVLLSFALLGIFPLCAKKVVGILDARKRLSRYKKPDSFDFNIIAIGAGAAGLVTSYIGATVKAKVALIERDKYGGDCLNYGCVPSKTLIKSAKIAHQIKKAKNFGLSTGEVLVDFPSVMKRVNESIAKIAPNDSPERYESLGVTCYTGNAKILSPYEVEVNGEVLKTRSIVIATGGSPVIPDIPGIDHVEPLTSETLWKITALPQRLLVLGGGPIGCELSQAFARLGSQVTLVHRGDQILPKEDADATEHVLRQMQADGVCLALEHDPQRFFVREGEKHLLSLHKGREVECAFDELLVAVGRKARVEGFGLEELNLKKTAAGTLEVNEYLQTSIPNIYACGDVVGPYQFTHFAAYQAWFCAVNSLFGMFRRFKVDYRVMPWVTYTDPEVARVGLNEQEAKDKGIPHEVTTYDLADLDRAITEGEDKGLVKVLTPPGSDKILGVTIVGYHAGDYLAEFVSAMKHGLGLKKILGTVHPYPTLAEANKYAAGAWQKAHKPEMLLQALEWFHRRLR